MTLAALRGRRSVVVSTLGITQTLSWGSTYYLTAVFADPVSVALGLPKVWFFRPSLLVGDRAESRPGERIGIAVGKVIAPLMLGGLRRYRPISVDAVAAAMIYAATRNVQPGVVESEEIARLAALSRY